MTAPCPLATPWCAEHDPEEGGTCRAAIATPGGWAVTLNQDPGQDAVLWLDDPEGVLHADLTDLDPGEAWELGWALITQATRAGHGRQEAQVSP